MTKLLRLLVIVGVLFGVGGCWNGALVPLFWIAPATVAALSVSSDVDIPTEGGAWYIESKTYTIFEGSHLSPGGVTMVTQAEKPKEILSPNHGFFYTEANNKSEWSIENKTIMSKLRAIENAPTMMGTAEATLGFFDYIERQMDAINFD